MKQAAMTANEYLIDAIDSIDKRFGDGYAQKHPELIVGFMTTAAKDFQACLISQQLELIAKQLKK
jgi:hypothetical protein